MKPTPKVMPMNTLPSRVNRSRRGGRRKDHASERAPLSTALGSRRHHAFESAM